MASDDEDYVEIGDALPFIESDGKKKTLTLQDVLQQSQKSLFLRGRPRFHGAFTGGFSAGFFNTVGTMEGWAPASFSSSREQKSMVVGRKPEDFMDEEDFGEHGIAPRHFATSENFSSEERNRKRCADVIRLTQDATLPASEALVDLIVPGRSSIGIRLLSKMGWKPGQGLGPRVKKKRKPPLKTVTDMKIYGCAQVSVGSDNEVSEDEGEMMCNCEPADNDVSLAHLISAYVAGNRLCSDSDDTGINLESVTFAPKDVAPISFTSKDNTHGLGYSGLNPRSALPVTSSSCFDDAPVVSSRGKGIRGQAFGVGALEEEDDDIYVTDSLCNYDQSMEMDDTEQLFGWTAPNVHKGGNQRADSSVNVNYVGKILDGFTLSIKPLLQKKIYFPPILPPGFRPVHRFKKTPQQLVMESIGECSHDGSQKYNKSKLNAVERGLMLGEKPIAHSVFDLIPKEDLQKLEAAKAVARIPACSVPSSSTVASGTTTVAGGVIPFVDVAPVNYSSDKQTLKAVDGSLSNLGIVGFQPFKDDPSTQARYARYMALLKQGVKDPYSGLTTGQMTEWEMKGEKDEFERVACLCQPLSHTIASRFTRATNDEGRLDDGHDKVSLSDEAKAAEMKMFGKLTRQAVEWHPHNMLCRRFNVPMPYPDSDMVGVSGLKRDKFSIFNFLSVPATSCAAAPNPGRPPVSETGRAALSLTRGLNERRRGRRKVGVSIFSVLDTAEWSSGMVHNAQTSQSSVQEFESVEVTGQTYPESEEKAPTEDLFRAIFKNSDSDSSSADERLDDGQPVSEVDVGCSRHNGSDDNCEASLLHSTGECHMIERENSTDNPPPPPKMAAHCQTATPDVLESPVMQHSVILADASKTSSLWRPGQWKKKSIFDVLDRESQPDSCSTGQQCYNEAEDRVPSSPTDISIRNTNSAYGPALPPVTLEDAAAEVTAAPSDAIDERVESGDEESRHVNLHRTHEHRLSHRQHRKHRKKKSKHKKTKKTKRDRKHSRPKSKRASASSSGDASSEPDSD